jgi:hypothetical protein
MKMNLYGELKTLMQQPCNPEGGRICRYDAVRRSGFFHVCVCGGGGFYLG